MASDRSLATTIFIGAVLASNLAAGCALAVQAPDPDRPRDEVPKCDTGKGLVAVDGLMGSLFALSSIGAFAGDETGTGIGLAAVSALFIASAARGNSAANNCAHAYEEYNVAVMRQQERQEVVAQQRITPKPAVKKKPAPKPKPKPVEAPEEQLNPPPVGPEETVEPAAPEYATPRPAQPLPQQPQPKPTPATPKQPADKAKPKPAPKPPADDDWGNFWKEAP